MSSISSVGSSIISSLFNSTAKNSKTSNSIENLFAQLDTSGKGYLEKSDLASAFSQISGTTASTSSTSATSSTASVDDVFSKLDGNGDGKVTKDEMSTGMQALADELDNQFNQMRMSGGTPPPPPSDSDTGFTKDELTSQISDIGSTDSKRSDLMSKIVANFDEADTDSDGKVSFKEAMSYDQQSQAATTGTSTSSSSGSTSDTAAATSSNSDLAIMKRIMELMQSYALSSTGSSSLASTLSVSA